MSAIHPLHDPDERVVVADLGDWDVRQFAVTDRRAAYFADRGFGHVQLWNAAVVASVITPSRLTAGHFELWIDGERIAARLWAEVELELSLRGIKTPGRNAVRAIERWFVLPTEARSGRLLRSWWAGVEEKARS